jgi:hypothetical protein
MTVKGQALGFNWRLNLPDNRCDPEGSDAKLCEVIDPLRETDQVPAMKGEWVFQVDGLVVIWVSI